MPRTFKLSAGASGNPLLAADSTALVDAIMEGGGASDYMQGRPDLYPGSMVQMAIAGEQASRLPDMYGRAAAYYDLEMNYQVDALSAALEPLLLAGVASVVGTIVVSIFLPMYGYLGKLGA
jgi:type IV pilus assembly protein PilC